MSSDPPKTTRIDPRPVSETPGLWPVERVSKEELAHRYPANLPGKSAAAEVLEMNQVVDTMIKKLMRSLTRHKERYLRAWMAHYGAHPSQVHIVMFPKTADVFGNERGEIMRLEYRKDTDQVAELVKAAQAIDETALSQALTGAEWKALVMNLRGALKPFERQS